MMKWRSSVFVDCYEEKSKFTWKNLRLVLAGFLFMCFFCFCAFVEGWDKGWKDRERIIDFDQKFKQQRKCFEDPFDDNSNATTD